MSYDQAQVMIDDESYDWSKDEFLKIAGNYKPSDLVKVVKNLYDLSLHLRNENIAHKRNGVSNAVSISSAELIYK